MSTINCPNCGRPLRPGAKFCGNCGATLPAGAGGAGKTPANGGNAPAGAPPPAAASPPPGDTVPCPHCGRPVRPNAKFCGNCGKPIEAPAATPLNATPPPPSASGQAPTLQQAAPGALPAAAPRPSVSGEQPRPTAGARPIAPPLPPAQARSTRRGVTLAAVAVLLAVCALLGVGGFFAARQFGFIKFGSTATEPVTGILTTTLETSPAATLTVFLPVSPTLTAAATLPFTPTLSGPAATTALTPTLAALVVPTQGVTEAESPMPTTGAPAATLPATVAPPVVVAAQILFEDSFDGELRDHWVTWGTPFAAIQSGFGDRYLSLRGEDPQASGVTNAAAYRVVNGPGTVIEFAGQLDPKFQNYMIFFDWDQETVTRGPGYRQPGVIHVEVRAKNVILTTPLTQGSCQFGIQEGRSHTYRIQILENQGVELYVDDSATPICPMLNMGLAPLPGKISFSGLGWISYVKVQQQGP